MNQFMRILAGSIALLLWCLVVPAQGQFGKLPGISKKDSKVSAGDIDAFFATAEQARTMMEDSAFYLIDALKSKELAQQLRDQRAAATKIADPKEKDAKLSEVDRSALAALESIDYDQQSAALEKEQDDKKRQSVSASMWNFSLAVLKDKALVERGRTLISSAGSNPTMMSRTGRLKDTVSSLAGQAPASAKVVAGLQKVAKAIKVTEFPKSESDTPKSIPI